MLKKAKGKLVEILIAVTTIVASFLLAIFAATSTIERQSEAGETLLREMGFLYFYNLHRAFDATTASLKQDPVTKKIYIGELRAILAKLDQLSTNPRYIALSQRTSNLRLLGSEIRAEVSQFSIAEEFSIRKSATLLMCATYSEESSAQLDLPDGDGVSKDIRTFSTRLCNHLHGLGA